MKENQKVEHPTNPICKYAKNYAINHSNEEYEKFLEELSLELSEICNEY